jgi:hypothetical protein
MHLGTIKLFGSSTYQASPPLESAVLAHTDLVTITFTNHLGIWTKLETEGGVITNADNSKSDNISSFYSLELKLDPRDYEYPTSVTGIDSFYSNLNTWIAKPHKYLKTDSSSMKMEYHASTYLYPVALDSIEDIKLDNGSHEIIIKLVGRDA